MIAQLNKNGLCIIKDLWDEDTHQPLPWPTLDLRCKLDERERNHTNNLIKAIHAQWQQLIQHILKQTRRGSCIQCYDTLYQDAIPDVFFHSCKLFSPF